MKKLSLTLTSFAFSLFALGSDNSLTSQEEAAGWRLLFDGKNPSANWRGYRLDGIPKNWVTENGTLFRESNGGDLITIEKFENFELELDWKISPKGNSGIMFRVQETDSPSWQTGPEIQILDNQSAERNKAGWLYALYPANVDATKPAGEWNHLRFTTKDGKCEHWINGVKYVEYEIGSEDWKAKVSASKFASMPGFATSPRGHLCLQDHGNPVWFKNIRVRPL